MVNYITLCAMHRNLRIKRNSILNSLCTFLIGVLTGQNAGFVSLAVVCVALTLVIIILSIALAITCWHKVMVVVCKCVHCGTLDYDT